MDKFIFTNNYLLLMKLYRAISADEMNDFELHGAFRTSRNTLEAKQFFKSKIAIFSFVNESRKREFDPPYQYLLTIDVDEYYLDNPDIVYLNLDGFDAISIDEKELFRFSFYVKSVTVESL